MALSLSLLLVYVSQKKKKKKNLIQCYLMSRKIDRFENGCDSFDGGAARSNVQDSDLSNNNVVAITQVGKRCRKLTSCNIPS